MLRDCPTDRVLEALIVGAASEAGVAGHVAGCSDCRTRVQALRENMAMIRELADSFGRPSGNPPLKEIAGYEVVEEISRGGQGVVYRAVQLSTKRTVALKMLHAGGWASRKQRARFEREAEIAASLRHPNIVSVYDRLTLADGRYVCAMEFVEGVRLSDWTPGHGPAASKENLRQRLRFMASLCAAVFHAHQNGVIHRDLKPSNILVDGDGQPHILDFGVARWAYGHSGSDITQAGEFAGTLAYASPEQVGDDNESIDVRSDLYSLGVVMHELLAGRMPYSVNGSLEQIIRTIRFLEPDAAGINNEVDTIVRKALAKDPSRRYQTALGLQRDIERYLAGEPIEAKRESTWYVVSKTVSRHRVAVGTIAGIAMLIIGFAVVMGFMASRLAGERTNLAAALRTSQIERGRALLEAGDTRAAETLLWNSLIDAGARSIPDWKFGFECSPEVARPYWALWQLFVDAPCVARFQLEEPTPSNPGIDEEAGEVVCVTRRGMVHRWTMDGVPAGAPRRLFSLVRESEIAGAAVTSDAALALVHQAERLWVYDLRTLEEVATTPFSALAAKGIRGFNINADGTLVIPLCNDRVLEVLDASTLRPIEGLERIPGIFGSGMSDDGERLATFDEKKRLSVFETRTKRPIYASDMKLTPEIEAWMQSAMIVFSPDASRLIMTIGAHMFDVDLTRSDPPRMIGEANAGVGRLSFLSDGERYAYSTVGLNIYVSRLNDARPSYVLPGFLDRLGTLCAGERRGRILAWSGNIEGGRLWEGAPNLWARSRTAHIPSVHSLATCPTAQRFATCGGDGCVSVWNFDSDEPEWSLRVAEGVGFSQVIGDVDLSPDGASVVTADYSGRVLLTRIGDSVPGKVLTQFTEKAHAVRFSPDGKAVACAGVDRVVRLIDVGSGAARDLTGHTDRISCLSFSPDGRWLASASADRSIIVWKMPEGALHARLDGNGVTVRVVTFTPDSALLISAGDDARIGLWNPDSGEQVTRFDVAKARIYGLAVHPLGNVIATGDAGGKIIFWDRRTGDMLATFDSGIGEVFALRFSHEGRHLIAAGTVGGLRIFDCSYYHPHLSANLRSIVSAIPARR